MAPFEHYFTKLRLGLKKEVMQTLIHALILCFVLEGICFALFPAATRKAMLELTSWSDENIRVIGMVFMGLAIALALILRLLR